jgi:L-fucose isomerase-like protein
VDVAAWAQQGRKADLIVTSEPGELDPYMRVFRTIRHLRKSKVLVMAQRPSAAAEAFTKQFGTAFAYPSYADLKGAFERADTRKAQTEAAEFARKALKVVEPRQPEIADSMRLYHAVLALLEQEKANAITIDCLGGFRRGDLPAYPCVAWSKLNDAGLYGVCEADVPSTITQILLTSLSGKPGFVSDPVFDTSRNEIIHAHCVSATCLHGIGGAASPYIVRTHMEDNKGVSLQVLVPTLETITCAKFLRPATLAVSTGTVDSNVDDPRGCRTKFRTRVADARKMVESFTGGLHRVIVYGDYVKPLERMGRLMGFQVVREG